MKIVVIGGTGTIGRAIVEEMQPRHEIVAAGRSHGDRQVDITDPASVQALFDHIGRFDALIAATGSLHFGPVTETTAEQFNLGLQDKLLGQIRVALAGQHHLNDERHRRRRTDSAGQQCHHRQCRSRRVRASGRDRAAARAAHQCRQSNHRDRICFGVWPVLSGLRECSRCESGISLSAQRRRAADRARLSRLVTRLEQSTNRHRRSRK